MEYVAGVVMYQEPAVYFLLRVEAGVEMVEGWGVEVGHGEVIQSRCISS